MGCNCATTEQINELYRKFGEKQNSKKGFSLKLFIRKTLTYICVALIIPFIILFVIGKGMFSKDRRISVQKFFNLKPHSILTNVG